MKIKGGLGNQMHQYAFGKKLENKYDVKLKLDLTWYDTKKHQRRAKDRGSNSVVYFHLSNFNASFDIADKEEVRRCKKFIHIRKSVQRLLQESKLNALSEKANSMIGYYNEEPTDDRMKYNPSLLETGKNSYVEGYFQSPRYYADIRGLLQYSFAVMGDLSPESRKVAKNISSTTSVGIHVRRGDFLENKNCLPVEYFQKGIEYFDSKDVKFFIFSSNPEWVKNNLKIKSPTHYVTHHHPANGTRTPDAYEYFELLKLCDKKIISNSSFSWWAAWLGNYDCLDVLCPYIWKYTTSSKITVYDLDMIPNLWEVVEW